MSLLFPIDLICIALIDIREFSSKKAYCKDMVIKKYFMEQPQKIMFSNMLK